MLSFYHACLKWHPRCFSYHWLHLICVVPLIAMSRPLLILLFFFSAHILIFFFVRKAILSPLLFCRNFSWFFTFSFSFFFSFFFFSIQEVYHPIQWIFYGRPFLVLLYFQPYSKGLLAHEIILDLLYHFHPPFKGNICPIQGLSLQKTIFFFTSTLIQRDYCQ